MKQAQLESLIDNLVALPKETETVEFKRNRHNKDDVGKRISALSNSANLYDKKKAYLAYGIEDNTHQIVGTSFLPSQEKVGNDELEFWLSRKLKPDIDFRIHEFKYGNSPLVLIEIPPAINQPVKFDNTAYIRVGSSTPRLLDYPEKERKIWNNINRMSFEKGIAKENLTTSEVLKLLDYSKYFSLTKQEIPANTQEFVEKMVQHRLVKKVFDNCYDITNLGAILFAKNLNSFPTVGRKSVRIVEYDGNSKVNRKNEYNEIQGYAITFESLLDFINEKLPHSEEISRSLRRDVKMYPEQAIREFVANALIHQDLSITGAGPMVEIFDNRIEFTNTGEPLIETDRFIDHPPRSRNEEMASFMRQIGVCEEGGTGVDRALTFIAMFQLPAPKFEKYDNFTKVTIYARKSLRDMTTDDKIRACFQHCVLKYVEHSRMTNASLRERLGIGDKNYPTASTIIRATIEKGLIKESEKSKEYVPSWV